MGEHNKEIIILVLLTELMTKIGHVICSDEGLTLETSAFKLFTVAQLTISTQLTIPNYNEDDI